MSQYEGDLFTPDTVWAEMQTIDNTIMAMVRDLQEKRIDDTTKVNFITFVREWKDFYDNNTGFGARMLNTTAGKVQEFRKRLEEWQKRLARYTPNVPMLPKFVPPARDWIVPVSTALFGALFSWWLVKR